jgi:membrane protein insertase Oxa1/YidC/SpoIIIJ
MLYIMPVFTGILAVNFASGLSIYWIIGNIATIAQYVALGRANLRNLLPEFLLPKTQSVAAPVKPTSVAKAIPAKATTNGTSSEASNKKRKANISGPSGRPVVSLSDGGNESRPIAAVPLRNKSKAKRRPK